MRAHTRLIRTRRERGERAVGVAIFNPSGDAVEAAGAAGADFVFIDAEHGQLGIREIADLVRSADAARIDAMVRVPDDSSSFIARCLDAGASGVIVPHIRSVEQLQRIIRATRYGPTGTRGACPNIRAVGHGTPDWAADSAAMDRDSMVWAIIEDLVDPAEAQRIVQTPGLDAVVIGVFDLSQSVGNGGIQTPEVQELIHTIRTAAAAASVDEGTVTDPSIHSGALPDMPILVVHSDRSALVSSFGKAITEGRRGHDGS